MIRHVFFIGLAVVAAACADTVEEPAVAEPEAPAGNTSGFAAELGVDTAASTRTSSGLYIRDLETGTGEEATAGRRVAVLYTGWLTDGTRFDGNQPNGPTLPFTIGAREVIQGWDEGVAGMRVGGRRQLVIPPELAYGPVGAGPIPPNSTLVFEVELVGVQ